MNSLTDNSMSMIALIYTYTPFPYVQNVTIKAMTVMTAYIMS